MTASKLWEVDQTSVSGSAAGSTAASSNTQPSNTSSTDASIANISGTEGMGRPSVCVLRSLVNFCASICPFVMVAPVIERQHSGIFHHFRFSSNSSMAIVLVGRTSDSFVNSAVRKTL
jgi:hypothetical protein